MYTLFKKKLHYKNGKMTERIYIWTSMSFYENVLTTTRKKVIYTFSPFIENMMWILRVKNWFSFQDFRIYYDTPFYAYLLYSEV